MRAIHQVNAAVAHCSDKDTCTRVKTIIIDERVKSNHDVREFCQKSNRKPEEIGWCIRWSPCVNYCSEVFVKSKQNNGTTPTRSAKQRQHAPGRQSLQQVWGRGLSSMLKRTPTNRREGFWQITRWKLGKPESFSEKTSNRQENWSCKQQSRRARWASTNIL